MNVARWQRSLVTAVAVVATAFVATGHPAAVRAGDRAGHQVLLAASGFAEVLPAAAAQPRLSERPTGATPAQASPSLRLATGSEPAHRIVLTHGAFGHAPAAIRGPPA